MDAAAVASYYRGKGYMVHESMLATGHSGNGHRVPLLCEGPLGNLAVFFGDAGGIDDHELSSARRVAKDLGATPVVAAVSFTNSQRATAAELGVVLLDRDAASASPRDASPMPGRPWPEAARAALKEDPFVDHPWPASGRTGGKDAPRGQTFEVDDLLRGLDRSTPEPVTPRAKPAAADEAGLWQRPRPTAAPMPATLQPAMRREGAKFAWLGATQTSELQPMEVALEHTDVVSTAAALDAAHMDPAPRTPQEVGMDLSWVRPAAWTLLAVVLVILFAIWWF